MRDPERIIEAVRRARPDVRCERLQVRHPGADDDGLWFFFLPGSRHSEVQIESSHGGCPFLVEGRQRRTGSSIEEVTRMVLEELSSTDGTSKMDV